MVVGHNLGTWMCTKKTPTSLTIIVLFIKVIPSLSWECNVALHRQTSQSSTYYTGYSCNAVDGNTNADYTQGSCSHTQSGLEFWEMDLEDVYLVNRLEVYLRTDRPAMKLYERFQSMRITVDGKLCNDYIGPPILEDINPLIIACDEGASGRQVKISKQIQGTFELCEVKVIVNIDGSPCPQHCQTWTCKRVTSIPITQCPTTQPEITTTYEQTTSIEDKTSSLTTTGMESTNLQETTTHSSGFSTLTSNVQCICPCSSLGSSMLLNRTVDEILERLAEIIQEIKVDKKQTKMALRKLISAKDDRPSSKTIGVAGVVFLLLLFGTIIAMDINILISCVHNLKRPMFR